jgi:glutamate racemase
MQTEKPILIFDSGVGGLSIFDAVHQQLPAERYVYACDNGAFPYGPKPEAELLLRVESVMRNLVARYDPKLIVIACNTASTLCLPRLRECFALPIIGVVPAIKPAAQLSQNKILGLLATPGTVSRRYTDQLINEFASDCDVIKVGSRELVLMAEAKLRGQSLDGNVLREILAPFIQEQDRQADTVILGCTHFPLLRDDLAAAAPSIVHWVDSGDAIARRVLQLLPYQASAAGAAQFVLTADDATSSALLPALKTRGMTDIEIFAL